MADLVQNNILLILGMFAFVLIAWSFTIQVFIARWPSTEGELLQGKVSEYRTEKNSDFFANVKYRYTVEGVEYLGTRLSPVVYSGRSSSRLITNQLKRVEYFLNGSVRVFYYPRNPQKSYLVTRGIFNSWVPET